VVVNRLFFASAINYEVPLFSPPCVKVQQTVFYDFDEVVLYFCQTLIRACNATHVIFNSCLKSATAVDSAEYEEGVKGDNARAASYEAGVKF
jgi:hypothetical protein